MLNATSKHRRKLMNLCVEFKIELLWYYTSLIFGENNPSFWETVIEYVSEKEHGREDHDGIKLFHDYWNKYQ